MATDFLQNLQDAGVALNAPLAADPNLNMAALALGAGLMQPVQAGSTPGAVMSNALLNSVNFLQKQRNFQAQQEQQKQLEQEKTQAVNRASEMNLEAQSLRTAQQQSQFEQEYAQRQRQHEETMTRLQSQFDLLKSQAAAGKLRDQTNVAKLGLDFADSFIENNPDKFVGADGKTPDPRAIQAFRTLQQNRMLQTFGIEPTTFIPYGPNDVQAVAALAQTDPQRFQLLLGDRALVYGPKYVDEVHQAVLKGPIAVPKPAAAQTAPATAAAPADQGFSVGGAYANPTEAKAAKINAIQQKINQLQPIATGQIPTGFSVGGGTAVTAADQKAAQQKIQMLQKQLEALRGQSQ